MTERIVDLTEANQKAANDEIWKIRAQAIQWYANLEQALCRLFSLVGEMPMDVAGIVFFKITSTQARNDIIEKLFKLRFRTEYHLFRNSLLKNLRPIDLKRNQIVHWNTVTEIGFGNKEGTEISSVNVVLKPPTHWLNVSERVVMEKNHLEEFIYECMFYNRIIGMFDAVNRNNAGPLSDGILKTWRDIFLQPVVYPPPKGSPLFQIAEELGIPAPPSPP